MQYPFSPGRAPAPHRSAGPAPSHGAEAPRTVGKYLVSPLIKASGDGWFASSVSIRSGSGQGTSDRILRMTRLFRCAKEAAAYAHAEALQWIRAAHPAGAAA